MILKIFKSKRKFGQIRVYVPDDNKLWKKFSSNAINELLSLNLPSFIIQDNLMLETAPSGAYLYNIKELEYKYTYKFPLAYLFHNYKIKRLIRKWNRQGIKTVLMWEV